MGQGEMRLIFNTLALRIKKNKKNRKYHLLLMMDKPMILAIINWKFGIKCCWTT